MTIVEFLKPRLNLKDSLRVEGSCGVTTISRGCVCGAVKKVSGMLRTTIKGCFTKFLEVSSSERVFKSFIYPLRGAELEKVKEPFRILDFLAAPDPFMVHR